MTKQPEVLDRLSTQVFLVSIAVAIVAALLTGALVRNRTIEAFEEAVERDLATDSAIYGSVSQFPFYFRSWADGQLEIESLSDHFQERIAITDLAGTTVLADSDPGAELPPEAVAVLVSDPFETEYDEDIVALCLVELSNLDALDDGVISNGVTIDDIDEDDFNSCLAENQVAPEANALLFLGYPTDSVDLGSLTLGGLVLGGSGVLLVAGLGAVLMARRVSEPVAELTHAAGRLAAGDLSQRVDHTGQGEIGALAQSFNDMARRLEEIDVSRQRLISDVAHELRNPIGALQGNLEAAQDGVLPLDDFMVASLVSETRHLGQLVRDLQDVNLAELQELRIHPQAMDLYELCAHVSATYRAMSPGHELRCIGSGAIVYADGLRIRQVVENLIKNALTHTEPGGTVTVAVETDQDRVRLTVTDTGMGITKRDLPHVFDRFWRADSSRTRTTGGTGLGLSICQAIVDAHGGRLTVASEPGVGTTFAATLPAAPAATPMIAPPALAPNG